MTRRRHAGWRVSLGLLALLGWRCGSTPEPVEPGLPGLGAEVKPLQPLVDAAPEGSVLQVPAGTWRGPVVLGKPLTLEGRGEVVLTGDGHGSVLTLKTHGAVVRGLRITGSGSSHDAMDSAVRVQGDGNRVEHNVLDDVLFGVFVEAGNRNVVCANRITSKKEDHSLRGDGVRVWNGRHNQVVGNDVKDARDVTLANAAENRVARNRIRGGRYGMQLVFAPRNELEENLLDGNLTGIAVLYSNDVRVLRNVVQHSRGVSGAGMAFKESGQVIVEENDVVHCAVGAKTNSPTSPEAIITFTRNRFAHNVAGMDFYGENGGHVLHGNRFEKNLVQVSVSAAMSARGNEWVGNYWDDYEGFDRDGNGVGDSPYEVYAFADRIWQEEPQATFFRNAPAMELLDFLERLAPFASPELTLRDEQPVAHEAADRAARRAVREFELSCP